MDGRHINLSSLINKKFRIEEINDVHEAMRNRKIFGRWICEFD